MAWFKWPKISKQELTSDEAKSEQYQRRVSNPGALFHYEDRPPFSMIVSELMAFDHKVTLALAIRNGLLAQMEVEFVGGPPGIRDYAARQWERIWTLAGSVIMEAKNIGWVGFEPMYTPGDQSSPDAGRAVFSGYRDFHPRDVRPLVDKGRIVGLTLNNCQTAQGGRLSLFNPKGCYITYRDRYSSYYGQSLLEHAYAPWHEKWQRGGAVKLRQLRMMKDAWVGDVIRYPTHRKTITPTGEVVSWRDVAREIVQLRQAGGVIGIPSDRTADGNNYEWEYTPPTSVEGATPIHEYKTQLDTEIFEGLEVPEEVAKTAEGGNSYNGRSIPMVGLLSSLQREGEDYSRQIDQQLIRPLARWEFGCEPSYTLKVKPIIKTIQKLMAGAEGDEQPGGAGKPPSMFSGFGMQRPPQVGPQQSAGGDGSAARYGASQFSSANSFSRTYLWRNRTSPRKSRPIFGSTVGGVYYPPGVWIESAALQFASDDELLQLADGNGERWITIGGRSTADGEHSGGFPVKLDKDGNIIAGGPPGLRGHHVSDSGKYFKEKRAEREKSGEDAFGDAAGFFDKIKGENDAAAKETEKANEADIAARGPGNTKSMKKIVAFQAEKWGMSEDTYQSFMDDVWKETLAFNQSREEFKAHAREATGLDAGKIKRIEEKGGKNARGGDSDTVKNLDTAADILAGEYPQFFEGSSDPSEKIFEILKEGVAKPLSRTSREFHDKIDAQLEELMSKAGDDYTAAELEDAAEPVGAGAGYDAELGFSGP